MSRVDVHRFGIGAARNRRRVAGLTLVEVMCAVALLLVLATIAMPLARNTVQRHKEAELRRDLNVICAAIDRYHQYAITGAIKPWDPDWEGYPPDLETLVEGVEITGTATGGRQKVVKILREIPVDPLTGERTWGLRSYQMDPDTKGWDQKNVWDVYSLSSGTALDGTSYSDWGCEDTSPGEPGFRLW
ncbi:MAG: general secretion pathway protein GspG [Acidobacteria bacterium]|nr:MAG: general secretion pathway protein GspG [Acidobacteriota bacterium]